MFDLFVCQYGEVRSPTALNIAMRFSEEQEYEDYSASCCGLDRPSSHPPNMDLFDRVFAMDDKIAKKLQIQYHIPSKKIINLNVSDTHSLSEAKFRDLLESELVEKLRPYFLPRITSV